jgi:hypothetical protein
VTAQLRVRTAMQRLAAADGKLADVLANLTAIVAEEAVQNSGFRAQLSDVLIPREVSAAPAAPDVVETQPRKAVEHRDHGIRTPSTQTSGRRV